MNNCQVCDVKKHTQHAVPEGSPLPLFFRCIAGQRSVDQKERPLIAGAFFCLKFECAPVGKRIF